MIYLSIVLNVLLIAFIAFYFIPRYYASFVVKVKTWVAKKAFHASRNDKNIYTYLWLAVPDWRHYYNKYVDSKFYHEYPKYTRPYRRWYLFKLNNVFNNQVFFLKRWIKRTFIKFLDLFKKKPEVVKYNYQQQETKTEEV
jgi:hypothetical protein